jgi:hypothetical protein
MEEKDKKINKSNPLPLLAKDSNLYGSRGGQSKKYDSKRDKECEIVGPINQVRDNLKLNTRGSR